MNKFNSKNQRIGYLIELAKSDPEGKEMARKLAYEWIRVGIFARRDFDDFLDAWETLIKEGQNEHEPCKEIC